jgi:hypothetical protein
MVTETRTVCGNQVQVDRSGGQGHAWVNVDREDLPGQIVLELEGEMLDGGLETCADYRASNGLYYRW